MRRLPKGGAAGLRSIVLCYSSPSAPLDGQHLFSRHSFATIAATGPRVCPLTSHRSLANLDEEVDVAIIGAGPAGLAAAAALRRSDTRLQVRIIDQGPLRQLDQVTPRTLVQGVGGAGLWSDGKFSFFPSATGLWRVADGHMDLHDAYEETLSFLRPDCPQELPPFPSLHGDTQHSLAVEAQLGSMTKDWSCKPYLSIYLDLGQRQRLIRRLYEECSPSNFMLESSVWSCAWQSEKQRFKLSLRSTSGQGHCPSQGSASTRSLHAQAVVIAGGRFWPLFNRGTAACSDRASAHSPHSFLHGQLEWEFRRFEFGVRVELPSQNHFFTKTTSALVDPKFTFVQDVAGVPFEFRTFCCCRSGMVCETEFNGLRTFSGRADVEPTSWSNIGLNVRCLDEAKGKEICKAILERQHKEGLLRGEPLRRSRMEAVFGELGGQAVLEALASFAKEFSSVAHQDFGDLRLWGPTVEGVGDYPSTSSSLLGKMQPKCPGRAYVVGDACGKFRGIIAAMVSGSFAGRQLAQSLAKTEHHDALASGAAFHLASSHDAHEHPRVYG